MHTQLDGSPVESARVKEDQPLKQCTVTSSAIDTVDGENGDWTDVDSDVSALAASQKIKYCQLKQHKDTPHLIYIAYCSTTDEKNVLRHDRATTLAVQIETLNLTNDIVSSVAPFVHDRCLTQPNWTYAKNVLGQASVIVVLLFKPVLEEIKLGSEPQSCMVEYHAAIKRKEQGKDQVLIVPIYVGDKGFSFELPDFNFNDRESDALTLKKLVTKIYEHRVEAEASPDKFMNKFLSLLKNHFNEQGKKKLEKHDHGPFEPREGLPEQNANQPTVSDSKPSPSSRKMIRDTKTLTKQNLTPEQHVQAQAQAKQVTSITEQHGASIPVHATTMVPSPDHIPPAKNEDDGNGPIANAVENLQNEQLVYEDAKGEDDENIDQQDETNQDHSPPVSSGIAVLLVLLILAVGWLRYSLHTSQGYYAKMHELTRLNLALQQQLEAYETKMALEDHEWSELQVQSNFMNISQLNDSEVMELCTNISKKQLHAHEHKITHELQELHQAKVSNLEKTFKKEKEEIISQAKRASQEMTVKYEKEKSTLQEQLLRLRNEMLTGGKCSQEFEEQSIFSFWASCIFSMYGAVTSLILAVTFRCLSGK